MNLARPLVTFVTKLTVMAAMWIGFMPSISQAANTFVNTGALATGRYLHTTTLLPNGKVLVTGGIKDNIILASAELYDPATGTWSATGSLTTARNWHTATLLPNGKVLVVGGMDDSNQTLASAELYDPVAGTWSAASSLAIARYYHSATLLPNGKVLVAGGNEGSSRLTSAVIYDPVSDSWATTGMLGNARYGHTATLLPDGKVLVAAGNNSTSNSFASAELYDPVSGTWATTGTLTRARSSHTATLLSTGKVLVVAGTQNSFFHNTAELYDPVSGIWTATASLSTTRYNHTATLLPNGKLLVTGGGSASAELYDSVSDTWSISGSLASFRSSHTATLLPNGKLLVAGGYGSGGSLSSAELYDPAEGAWTVTGALATGRSNHTETVLPNGKVLVAGGRGNSGTLASTELYNSATGIWTATGALANGREYHTVTLLPNGKVLVAGGSGSGGYLASAELYDPATGAWTATGNSLTTARYMHTATLLPNGKVLVTGGFNNGGILASAELYDPATGTWTATGALTTGRQYHTSTLLPNGKVLVAGGRGSSGTLASTELYDPATGIWTDAVPLTTVRENHIAMLLATGKLLIAAGAGGGGPLASAELYDPVAGSWIATGSLVNARQTPTATLLPNGKLLIAGGFVGWGLASAELYDSATGIWTATGSLTSARNGHTMTLLPSGKVLVAGGYYGGSYPANAELYDVGLGFAGAARPVIGSASFNAAGGLVLTGTGFFGISSASGGNGSQDSPTNYPVLQLRRLDNEQCSYLSYDPSVNVSATSLTSSPVAAFSGYALATVFTNGIPSESALVSLPAPSFTGITPSSGSTAGGTNVTITGAGFTGASAVTFGGIAATSFTVDGPTSITATTPAHAAGIVNVAVTTDSGTGTGTNLFTYVAPAPAIALEAPTGSAVSNGSGTLDYGTIPLGQTRDLNVTVSNTGNEDLIDIAASLTGPDAGQFSLVSAPPATLAPGASSEFTLRFSPTYDRAITAALSIASNDPDDHLFTLALTGAGTSYPLTYSDDGTSVTITGCDYGYSGALIIPDSINGMPVTSIGYRAFDYHTNLTNVTIPASVTSIGDSAFSECYGLTNVTIGSGVTSIGDSAFYYCYGLTSVTIPASVTSIGSYAFFSCIRLTSITFQGNAPTMGEQVFDGAASGFTVSFDLSNIGFTAPSWNGYPSIGSHTSAPFTYTTTDGTGIAITGCDPSYSGALVIPASIYGQPVTSIGDHAFDGYTGLTGVTIPGSVTSIADSAFSGCSSLTSVTFQGNAPTMGTEVFDSAAVGFTVRFDINKTGFVGPTWYGYASSGTGTATSYPFTYEANGTSTTITHCDTNYTGGLVIPESFCGQPIIHIEARAFADCLNLTGVTIPASITNIEDDAFFGSGKLTSATFNGDAPTMGTQVFGDTAIGFTVRFDLSKTGFTAPTWKGYASIGTGTSYPLTYTTNGTGLTITGCDTNYSGDLDIPASFYGHPVTSIGNYAFRYCFGLTGVTIPVGVTSIGAQAFAYCYDLTSVTIPASVTSIGDYAFYRCLGLTGVTVGSGVSNIGKYVFYGCSNLTSATFQGDAPIMGLGVFDYTAAGFTVHSIVGNTGFDLIGYPTVFEGGEITLEQPVGTNLSDGETRSFGSVVVGDSSSLAFTIKNFGNENLTGLAVAVNGDNASAFTVTQNPAASVAVGGSTTFVVRFAPGTAGEMTAALQITGNDSSESPFESNIDLTGTGTAPEITLDSIADGGSISYGSVLTGSSKSLTYTIRNTGTANLTGIDITRNGVNGADFAITTAPATSVAPGDSTSFVVEFTPGAIGNRSAAIHIASNDANVSLFDINLIGTGTGTAPEITIDSIADGGSMSYGSVLTGSSKSLTYTIRNTGTGNLTGIDIAKNGVNAVDFTIISAPTTLVAPGDSTTFVVEFTPGAIGNRSAAIHIASNDANVSLFDINLIGTGTGTGASTAPEIAIDSIADGGSMSYGSVLIGSSKSLTYTIRNTGTADLTGIAISKNGVNAADFTITSAPAASVASGGSTTFVVKFTPGAIGNRSADLHIASNDANESPFDINLIGTGAGTAPKIAVDSIADGGSMSYGGVLIGSSKSYTYTIRNTGTANLTGIAITNDGTHAADFAFATAPAATVAPGGKTTFVVKFTPGAIGNRGTDMHITSNEKPFDINLSGAGIAPEIAVQQPLGTKLPDGGFKSYGKVSVGSSKSLTYTIQNTGTSNLTGIVITKNGVNAEEFKVMRAPATTVAPGGKTTFVVKFTPKTTGNRIAVIHIANNDRSENRYDIQLSGTGTTGKKKGARKMDRASVLLETPSTTKPADISKTVITVDAADGLKYQTLVVMKAPGTEDQRRPVEVSSNLIDWLSGRNHTTVLRDDAKILKVRDNTPLSPGTKRYIRLRNPRS